MCIWSWLCVSVDTVCYLPDAVVSCREGVSNGVKEGDKLFTVDLTDGADNSPGTSESGESETHLPEDGVPGPGQEAGGRGTEMVDYGGGQKKPPKKKPVLTVSFINHRG